MMKNRVAVVTGGLSGIGRAAAEMLARHGAAVVVSGRNEAAGAALVQALAFDGARAAYIHCDVRQEADIKALVGHAVSRFGRLDCAVNNAGTDGASRPLVEQTGETYAETFDINVRGTLLCMKYEMQAMMAQGQGGSIVNLSSTMAFRGRPGLGLYCASKMAVEGLTRVGAIEGAAHNIRVNAIAPGQIDTPMLDRVAATRGGKDHIAASVPLKRVGTPEEAANLILFLCSDQSSYITGQSVAIEGGRLAQ